MSEKKIKVKKEKKVKIVNPKQEPMEKVPEVKTENKPPKPLLTKEERAQIAKAQWANPESRAKLKFGIDRLKEAGSPKRGTPEHTELAKETKRLLASGEWKTYQFKAKEPKKPEEKPKEG